MDYVTDKTRKEYVLRKAPYIEWTKSHTTHIEIQWFEMIYKYTKRYRIHRPKDESKQRITRHHHQDHRGVPGADILRRVELSYNKNGTEHPRASDDCRKDTQELCQQSTLVDTSWSTEFQGPHWTVHRESRKRLCLYTCKLQLVQKISQMTG